MTTAVFIDGEAGTTGLQIRDRLEARDDISLVSVPTEHRKDAAARKDAFAEADVSILCLTRPVSRTSVAMPPGRSPCCGP